MTGTPTRAERLLGSHAATRLVGTTLALAALVAFGLMSLASSAAADVVVPGPTPTVSPSPSPVESSSSTASATAVAAVATTSSGDHGWVAITVAVVVVAGIALGSLLILRRNGAARRSAARVASDGHGGDPS